MALRLRGGAGRGDGRALPSWREALSPLPLLAITCIATLVSCGVDLQVPPGVEVQCSAAGECPSDARCNAITGLCEFNVGVSAPSTAFAQIGPSGKRAAALVHIEVDALDSNAPPVGDETVRFSLAYSRDGSTWCDAALEGGAVPVVRAEATRLRLIWNALGDAQRLGPGGPCGLATTEVPGSPDEGSATTTVLAFADGLRLRLTAIDSGSPPSRSDIVSPTFALGNDAPVAGLVDDGAVLRQASPFEYTLSDSAVDEARLEVQFRMEGPTPSPWYTAQIRGATSSVLADPPGEISPRLLVWNADAPLPTTGGTGGIGSRNSPVSLRIRGVEDILEGVTTYGAWATRSATVFNQTAPIVGAVDVAPVERGAATSIVMIGYEVIDGESNLVDMRVEYRLPSSTLWSPATPFPTLPHSGDHDLETSPTSPPRHVFMWNVAADIRNRVPQLAVRLTAADDGGPGSPAEVAVSFPVGLEPVASLTHPLAQTMTHFSSDPGGGAILASGDFNGDGVLDFAVWAGNQVETYRGIAGGGIGAHASTTPSRYRSRSLVIADFNGDGRDDFAGRVEQDNLEVRLGSASGITTTGASSLDPGGTRYNVLVVAGDFDGNGTVDLATNGFVNPVGGPFDTLRVYRGNGSGSFASAETTVLGVDEEIYGMAAGDFDGDGCDDLAVAVRSGEPIGAVNQIVPLEVRVRRGSTQASPPFAGGVETVAAGFARNNDAVPVNAALTNANLFGDARDELVFLDLQQSNVGRVRVLARDGTWATRATVTDLPPLRRLRVNVGAPDVIVVSGPADTRGYAWDAAQTRLQRVTPQLDGLGDDLFFGDLNGDGRRDMMLTTNSALQWRPAVDSKGLAPGAFDAGADFSLLAPEGNLKIVAADNDEDGMADLLAVDGRGGTSHTAAAFHAESVRDVPTHAMAAIADPVQVIPGGTLLNSPTDSAGMGDFNGDGQLDALIAATEASYFVALGNGGAFGLAPGNLLTTGGGAYEVLVGDFDGDGRDDVLSTDFTDAIHYARFPAQSAWQGVPFSITDTVVYAIGDADNDGIDDVIVGTSFSPLQVRVYFGNTTPGLTAPVTIALPGGATAVTALAVGDVDGDGANEIVAASGGLLRVYDATRAGLTALPTSSASVAYQMLELVDVDADGILDVTGSLYPNSVERIVYVSPGLETGGSASGQFGAASRVLGPIDLELGGGTAWADANRDGLPDLFIASTRSGLVRVFYSHRYHPLRSWSATLDASTVIGSLPALDRFGGPAAMTITARRTVDRPTVVSSSSDLRADFSTRLRNSGQTLPANARAASLAWLFSGQHVASFRGSASARRGFVRDMLADREAVIRVPLYAAATTDATKLLVYARRITDYENDDGELPTTADGRTTYRPVETWAQLTRVSDLATGSGPRFVVDAANREIRIATDALGVFRVYAIP